LADVLKHIHGQPREKPMAEFDIRIDMDDDELYGSIEVNVESAIDEKMDDFDITDAVSEGIWNFRQWDEIIEKEVVAHAENWGLALQGDSSFSSDDLADGVENLLEDFMNQSSATRCGVGKAFAGAVTHMIEEYVEGPGDITAVSCKCDEVLSAFRSMFDIMADTIRQLES
jgi:hypothetical protein